MCIQEQAIRYSSSNVTGRFPDTFGHRWQEAANHLQKIAHPFGSIIKIDITRSQNDIGFLSFVIFYDDVAAAKKFVEVIQALSYWTSGPIILLSLAYQETPRQNED
ncbi:hypothetical protein I4U23_008073 [Adineta vaga]|nr:hypothetical protein I4U23_008073 [Adineta vaga]